MVSPETGAILRRDVRQFEVVYKGQTKIVDLPGYYPEGDGDGVHVGDDMAIADAALRDLKEHVDAIPAPATIRLLRSRLKLSQRDAGRLFKVGESAFDKYERGLVEPSGPTVQLMKLLTIHPDLVKDLR
ncbi:type II toxin-antitoxin system MqsA family antitoxin [Salmonella enterica subsp. enterica serovar Virchow]|nr:type II toxin-antitoxin system MqsA family antitoxin [Salmonella enterica subsp. enterica serovar Typhi]EBV3600017.1 type II toxin-antitoxin system MqsA family antitoxin [Salmonella enterica subsp. enterica serovar Virchow]EBW2250054.1 type II toxin-antitoxin system MqsA family antitoxin [Salmonella enterica subsp. enterica serovar Enteritidis]EBX4816796.1 type II toxin-antitoxin system MqsA family antitoxin [Salmonella enterica subsp. enterica serovar Newport]MIL09406.1 type II toxin-antito